jgi:hypothetical protein
MVFLHFQAIFESLHNQSCGKRWSKNQEYATTQLTHGTQFSHSSLNFSRDEPPAHARTRSTTSKTKQPWTSTTQNKATNHPNGWLHSEMRQQQAAQAVPLHMAILQRLPTPSTTITAYNITSYTKSSDKKRWLRAAPKFPTRSITAPTTARTSVVLPSLLQWLRLPISHCNQHDEPPLKSCWNANLLSIGVDATNNRTTATTNTLHQRRIMMQFSPHLGRHYRIVSVRRGLIWGFGREELYSAYDCSRWNSSW